MKFATAKQQVYSSGETKTFGMTVNAKAFSIVSGDLYNNISKAVVREYSTNALDSHYEANNPDPFDVHVPTEQESYFYVRDYGVGLDKEEFEKVFFTYFESTKDDSNDFNGCLGLGSKCIFGTQSGSGIIESWKNGIHYIYQVFIGKSGLPEYTLLSEKKSSERTGVKIRVDVPKNEITTYVNSIEEVYRYFERKPNFVNQKLNIDYLDYSQKYSINSHTYDSLAIMGNVAYPIERNFALEKYKTFINSNLILFFDIGDLNFTPSRESLKYTDRTIKKIKDKFEEIKLEILKNGQEEIDNAENEFAAHMVAANFFEKCFQKYRFLGRLQEFTYRGKTYKLETVAIPARLFTGYYKNGRDVSTISFKNAEFVINDLKIGAIVRCKQHREKTGKNVYLISEEEYDKISLTKSKKQFVMASDIEYTKASRITGNSKLTKLMKFVNNYRISECWVNEDVDIKTPQYYIIRKAYRPILFGEKRTAPEIFHTLKQLDINNTIYGINPSEEDKLKKLGWTHIEEYINKKISKLKKYFKSERATFKKLENINYIRTYHQKFIHNITEVKKNYALKCEDINLIYGLIKFYEKNEKKYGKLLDCKNLLRDLKIENNTINNQLLDKYIKKVIKKYPLLNNYQIGSYYNKIGFEEAYHYIMGVNYVNGKL